MTWGGKAPTTCDTCEEPLTDTFVDGRTVMGPWANMCPPCHDHFGVGLGTGKGQLYKLLPDGRWELTPR